MMGLNLEWYKNRKVLVTGHTGFKGTWLCKMLINAGADVMGYSLEPPTNPNLFSLCGIEKQMSSIMGDIRDRERLLKVFQEFQPEIVIHLAAQSIVRSSYKDPVYTYETNVLGTVNICEAIRLNPCVKSFLNVTTDKVYQNKESVTSCSEDEPLDGYDPYSNSKSCSELITHCYINSFYSDMEVAVSTVRSGNVIGGGDFAKDRIIPDCIKAISENRDIVIRNPHFIRPYQHVLEALTVYLLIVQKQYEDCKYAGFYNVGPDDCDYVTNGQLVDLFCEEWGNGLHWVTKNDQGPHESNFLQLDCSRIKSVFGWQPKWHIKDVVKKTVEWARVYFENGDVISCMDEQLKEFFEEK